MMTELLGYNNLTKSLSFNLYDFAVALNDEERLSYVRYIDARYSARQIEATLIRIAETIDAKVINVSSKDFEPYGASVVLLMSEELDQPPRPRPQPRSQPRTATVNIHLDKSHICAHTYPECLDPQGICSFRVDIDIATCGSISPLYALDFMFESFESDYVHIDYAVRGFTRDTSGKKIFIDHEIESIVDFISPQIRDQFECVDSNNSASLSFQSKLRRKDLNTSSYFKSPQNVAAATKEAKMALIKAEIDSIAHGRS
jgi:S-adenosylmethionine decarboxylase